MKRLQTANVDIRTAAKGSNVFLYEIAKRLGYSECHFLRLMRDELDPERKRRVFEIIREIASSR